VILAPDLLAGRRVAVAGGGPIADTIAGQLQAHAATVDAVPPELIDAGADEEAAVAWARERAPWRGLVVCAADRFAAGGGSSLRASLELTWRAARALATGALIDAGAPGRLLFVAPRPDAGPFAGAARDGLENLARTLSVEWARHQVTAVAIAPGAATTDAEVAQLVGFVVSDAGGYLSGCRLELGAAAAS
jgi:NAD(P)-dependent dehydrogenase (short-subunit alcohol dehydrogenase family)